MPTDAAAATVGSMTAEVATARTAAVLRHPIHRVRAERMGDWVFRRMTPVSRCWCWACLAGILMALGIAAAPALEKFGIGFFFTNVWDPVKGIFGGLAPIYGTLRHVGDCARRSACR